MKKIQKPYALFIGDAPDMLAAKTAIGVRDWRPDDCIVQVKLSGCAIHLGLESLTIEEAANRGAKTLMIGVANRGGVIPNNWLQTMLDEGVNTSEQQAWIHNAMGSVYRYWEGHDIEAEKQFLHAASVAPSSVPGIAGARLAEKLYPKSRTQ